MYFCKFAQKTTAYFVHFDERNKQKMLEQEKIVIDNIQKLLKEQSKRRKDLCDYLGVAHTNFGNWASGRNTGYMKMLHKIATYFNVSTDYLLGYEVKQKNNDAIADIVVRMRRDIKFFETVKMLDKASEEQLTAVNSMLLAFNK